jgi:hypothetical protein
LAKTRKEYSEETQQLLLTVIRDCESEDASVRERQLRQWRRLKLLWEGFTRVWYSEVAHDWRIWGDYSEGSDQSDQSAYDKSVNVFRAYLESIIAALSITTPPVKCYPDDAESTLDINTAKAGDKTGSLLFKHNDASMLWLHGLFIYCTEGMVAHYNYDDKNKDYGTYTKNKTEEYTEHHEITTCSNCGAVLGDEVVQPDENGELPNSQQQNQTSAQQPNQPPQQQSNRSATELKDDELSEFDPGPDDVELQADLNEGKELCPVCMQLADTDINLQGFTLTRIVGTTTEAKSRVKQEIFGGMNVKVPNYARNQKECGYLIYSYEEHYAAALDRCEKLKDNEELIKQIEGRENKGAYDQYDSWARLSPQYMGEYPINVVTRKLCWLRPWQFNVLKDQDDVKKLKKLFPFGVCVEMINETYASAYPECLDDHWTINYNPLADYIHYDPLGLMLASIQDLTLDLVSLIQQTVEHGVGLTFVDPAFIDTKAYAQQEVTPGSLMASKPINSSKKLSDGIFETSTATLGAEVIPWLNQVQSLGQLVSGALPSLFGGAVQQQGGNTASEYSMSRAQALQRQQNVWKMLTTWWKNSFSKAIPQYINIIKEQGDERDVQRDKRTGDFINITVKQAELAGKIGKVELEANENIPMTFGQRKDVIMSLLQAANPQLLELMNAPENRGLLYEALGLDDLFVPGSDDRERQLEEIQELLNTAPLETGDKDIPEEASVQIDPDYDNHQLQFEIVRQWVMSEAGKQAKVDNPDGYRNVLLHGKAHLAQQQNQEAQAAAAAQGNQPAPTKAGAPLEKPNQTNLKTAPISGNEDVKTQ